MRSLKKISRRYGDDYIFQPQDYLRETHFTKEEAQEADHNKLGSHWRSSFHYSTNFSVPVGMFSLKEDTMSDFMINASPIMYIIGESTEALLKLVLTIMIIMIILKKDK